MIFVNGLPLGLIELKNPTDEKSTIHHAFNQLQTYKNDIQVCLSITATVVSTAWELAGDLTAVGSVYAWRTIDGKEVAPRGSWEHEVLLKGYLKNDDFATWY